VHEQQTVPEWDDAPPGEDARPVSVIVPAPVAASFLARLIAGLVDLSVALCLTLLTLAMGALAYGAGLESELARGADALLDGLWSGRALMWLILGLFVTMAVAYSTLAHALAGATLGKWLMRLQLVDADDGVPSAGDALARSLLALLSLLPAGLGYLMALFDRDGLALHDRIVGTRLLREPPLPSPAHDEPPAEADVDG